MHNRTNRFVSQSPPVPWRSILKSAPFWAILVAHMGQNYGYETLMTELPTFMKQVLHFNIKAVSTHLYLLLVYINRMSVYTVIYCIVCARHASTNVGRYVQATVVRPCSLVFFLSLFIYLYFLFFIVYRDSEQTSCARARNVGTYGFRTKRGPDEGLEIFTGFRLQTQK